MGNRARRQQGARPAGIAGGLTFLPPAPRPAPSPSRRRNSPLQPLVAWRTKKASAFGAISARLASEYRRCAIGAGIAHSRRRAPQSSCRRRRASAARSRAPVPVMRGRAPTRPQQLLNVGRQAGGAHAGSRGQFVTSGPSGLLPELSTRIRSSRQGLSRAVRARGLRCEQHLRTGSPRVRDRRQPPAHSQGSGRLSQVPAMR